MNLLHLLSAASMRCSRCEKSAAKAMFGHNKHFTFRDISRKITILVFACRLLMHNDLNLEFRAHGEHFRWTKATKSAKRRMEKCAILMHLAADNERRSETMERHEKRTLSVLIFLGLRFWFTFRRFFTADFDSSFLWLSNEVMFLFNRFLERTQAHQIHVTLFEKEFALTPGFTFLL